MQQRGSCGVAFGILHRVADQPIEVVTFELVSGAAKGHGVAHAVKTGACAEDVVKSQRTQGSVATGAAAADECLVTVNQPAVGQMGNDGTGVFDIHPPQLKCSA